VLNKLLRELNEGKGLDVRNKRISSATNRHTGGGAETRALTMLGCAGLRVGKKKNGGHGRKGETVGSSQNQTCQMKKFRVGGKIPGKKIGASTAGD